MSKIKLGDITKIRTGKLDANASSENGKYPFFTCSKDPLRIDSYSYDCECVLVAGNGDLNVKYYKGKFDAYQRTYIIEDNSNGRLFIPYLYYFLELYVEELRKQSIGGVIKYIKLGNLTDAIIELPSIEKQKEIVNILDKSRKIVDSKNVILQSYDQLIKSRFVEMFGQDLEGKSIRLGDLTEVITKGTTPTTLGYDFVDDGIKFVKVECITETGKFIKEKMLHINDECNEKLKRSKLKKDDILFSIAGAIGRTAIVTDDILPANTNQALSIIRLKKDAGLNVEFLSQVFKTDLISEQIEKRVNGVAQMNVSLADIGNLNIIRPSIERQNEFAQFAQQVDKLKFVVQQSLDETQKLFDSLMQKYFG